jgi:hypothetical protein
VPRRDQAVVICSCGWKVGNMDRARACEEMEAVEYALVAASVERLVRHHELGHRFTLGPNAPRSFLAVIAEAARRVAEQRGGGGEAGDVEEPGRLRLAAIED